MKDLCETYLEWYRYIPWGQTTAAYCPSSPRIKPVKDKGQPFSIYSIDNTYHMKVLYFVLKEKVIIICLSELVQNMLLCFGFFCLQFNPDILLKFSFKWSFKLILSISFKVYIHYFEL